MSAYTELVGSMQEGEAVQAIVFGVFGDAEPPAEGEDWTLAPGEPSPPPVPLDQRGRLLTLTQAEPFMQSWSFYGGYGGPRCYAVYVWTNRRVIWVQQYAGETWLSDAPRDPVACVPVIHGG
jgi:hypothetical protein